MSIFEDIWESIVDGWESFWSFEWVSDIWEFITGMFSNLGEFSMAGLIGGAFGLGFILLTSKWMLKPFTEKMTAFGGIFISILVHIMAFAIGYLWFKQMVDN